MTHSHMLLTTVLLTAVRLLLSGGVAKAVSAVCERTGAKHQIINLHLPLTDDHQVGYNTCYSVSILCEFVYCF